jgi:hypothetical protein
VVCLHTDSGLVHMAVDNLLAVGHIHLDQRMAEAGAEERRDKVFQGPGGTQLRERDTGCIRADRILQDSSHSPEGRSVDPHPDDHGIQDDLDKPTLEIGSLDEIVRTRLAKLL